MRWMFSRLTAANHHVVQSVTVYLQTSIRSTLRRIPHVLVRRPKSEVDPTMYAVDTETLAASCMS